MKTFVEDNLDKRIEDYCNKKHLCRLYGNKPVVMKEIKISLKEFAKQETKRLEEELTEKNKLIEKMKQALIDIKANTDDVNIEWQIKYLFDEFGIKE